MSRQHLVVVGAILLTLVAVGVATRASTSTLPGPADKASSASLSIPQHARADGLFRATAVPSLPPKQVSTPAALLAELTDLRATVDAQVPDAQLAKSLDAQIDAIAASVRASQYSAAALQLDAFGNQVDAAEKTGKLGGAISNVLKTKHDTVKNSIGNIRRTHRWTRVPGTGAPGSRPARCRRQLRREIRCGSRGRWRRDRVIRCGGLSARRRGRVASGVGSGGDVSVVSGVAVGDGVGELVGVAGTVGDGAGEPPPPSDGVGLGSRDGDGDGVMVGGGNGVVSAAAGGSSVAPTQIVMNRAAGRRRASGPPMSPVARPGLRHGSRDAMTAAWWGWARASSWVEVRPAGWCRSAAARPRCVRSTARGSPSVRTA